MKTDLLWPQDLFDVVKFETAFGAAGGADRRMALAEPTAAETAHALENVQMWRGYLSDACIASMINDGWQWST